MWVSGKMTLWRAVPGSFRCRLANVDGVLGLAWSLRARHPADIAGLAARTVEGVYRLHIGQLAFRSAGDVIVLSGAVGGGRVEQVVDMDRVAAMFERFYPRYVRRLEGIHDKYLSPFEYVGRMHRRAIEGDRRVREAVDRYLRGDLMYVFDGKALAVRPAARQTRLVRRVNPIRDRYVGDPATLLRDMAALFPRFRPYSKAMTLWRGVTAGAGSFEEGAVVDSPVPMSTSLLPYVSRDFVAADCCLLEVSVPAGHPSIFVHKYDPWQHEVILAPGRLAVRGVRVIRKGRLNEYLGDPSIPFVRQFWKEVNYGGDLRVVRCEALAH